MNFKTSKFVDSAKNTSMQVLRILISIASIVLLFVFFRWVGWKGMLAFFLGMGVMTYLFLSKNMMIKMVVEYFEASTYVDEMAGGTKTATKTKIRSLSHSLNSEE